VRKLPHCDELFLRYFNCWCDDDDRKRRGFSATRPDMLQMDSLVGLLAQEASPLAQDSQDQVLDKISAMIEAAEEDWQNYLKVYGKLSLDWIEAFDEYHDRKRIQDVIDRSDPANFTNDYVIVCCEFGAALGHVLQSLQPRLVWLPDWPYWESSVFDPKTGSVLPVFHWAVKKMSEYGVDDGFAEKVQACIQLLDKPR
jgi:hypothetical protein